MAHGFVYILANPSMPGIYKIGFTLKHPRERMAELSKATACPTPFDLIAFIGCEDPYRVEHEIHRALNDWRVNESREFFNCPLYEIQDQLRRYGDPSFDCFYSAALDFMVDKELAEIDEAMARIKSLREVQS